jgi:hypothetical protein
MEDGEEEDVDEVGDTTGDKEERMEEAADDVE